MKKTTEGRQEFRIKMDYRIVTGNPTLCHCAKSNLYVTSGSELKNEPF